MIIELGNGYRIDSSDRMNWTLTCDTAQKGDKAGEKLSRPAVLGYHANLRYALEAAVRHGLATDDVVLPLKKMESRINAVADAILGPAKAVSTSETNENPKKVSG